MSMGTRMGTRLWVWVQVKEWVLTSFVHLQWKESCMCTQWELWYLNLDWIGYMEWKFDSCSKRQASTLSGTHGYQYGYRYGYGYEYGYPGTDTGTNFGYGYGYQVWVHAWVIVRVPKSLPGYGYKYRYPGTSIMGTGTRFSTRVWVLILALGYGYRYGVRVRVLIHTQLKIQMS